MYRVAIFFEAILAFSALSSDNVLSINPSPLHSAQIPEPPQSSQTFKELSAMVGSEAFVVLARSVAAALTAMAETITDAAVSGNAEDTRRFFCALPCELK